MYNPQSAPLVVQCYFVGVGPGAGGIDSQQQTPLVDVLFDAAAFHPTHHTYEPHNSQPQRETEPFGCEGSGETGKRGARNGEKGKDECKQSKGGSADGD